MSSYVIDPAKLPPPDVVEPLSYEEVFSRKLARQAELFAELGIDALALESEPARKLLRTAAEDELLLRQRVNDAARAVMLPFAMDADLDNLAALVPLQRGVLSEGDPDAFPPVQAVRESNAAFRRRVQLAPEGFSTAGAKGAYVFNGLSAGEKPSSVEVESPEPGVVIVTHRFDPDGLAAQVKDIRVHSPEPGWVQVAVLGWEGDGSCSLQEAVSDATVTLENGSAILHGRKIENLVVNSENGQTTYAEGTDYGLDGTDQRLYRLPGGIADNASLKVSYDHAGLAGLVDLHLNGKFVRPLTDYVESFSATVERYSLQAVLTLYPGYDEAVIQSAAHAAITARVEELHRLGFDHLRDDLKAALKVEGVYAVELMSPAADIIRDWNEAAFCEALQVTVGGRNV